MPVISIADNEARTFKIKSGKYAYPVTFTRNGDTIWLGFGYNKDLLAEFKTCFSGMKWHGYDKPTPIKKWTIDYNEHNRFQISYLAGFRPYEDYKTTFDPIEVTRPLKEHQIEMASFVLQNRAVILAAEMGLGKSLTMIEAFEQMRKAWGSFQVFWVSKGSALYSAKLEYSLWKATAACSFYTYDGLKKYVTGVKPGTLPPRVLILDEAQAVKNITSQRSQAANHVAKSMREVYGRDCLIVAMSGSPAPKSPLDWYSICEIVCPGFLKEGTIHAFKDRLGVVRQQTNVITGGVYPELVGWRDNTEKCYVCGEDRLHNNHLQGAAVDYHEYVQGKDEVSYLYERMKGLVMVKFKRDCLDLPDKIYQKIYCKPSQTTLRAMKLIMKTAPSTIKALTLLRELSDGFQYGEEQDGEQDCPVCLATGKIKEPVYIGPPKTKEFLSTLENFYMPDFVDIEDIHIDPVTYPQYFEDGVVECPRCNGTCKIPKYKRIDERLSTGKDQAVIDLLDEHEEVGRLVIYAGFTASIDRCLEIAVKQKWSYIRVDGRGWHSDLPGNPEKLIKIFQDKLNNNKIVFIGHPGTAGTGLTLTASPSIVYYSNDFVGESRIQSEDRIHRIGMDVQRGARIIDLIHLPTDEYVLENLNKKKKLQNLTLGEIAKAADKELERVDYE